jgi:hypothetical protein
MTVLPIPAGVVLTPPVRSAGAKVVWTVLGLVVAIGLTGAVVFGTVIDTAYQKVPVRQHLFTSALSAVSVRVGTGSVTIEPATGSRTVVTTWGTRGLSWPTDRERVSGRSLVVSSTCGSFSINNCTRNYVIHIQPEVSVTIDSGQGTIVVDAVRGPLTLNSGDGNVSVRDGDGVVRATTGQGNISLSGQRADTVDVGSGQGDGDLGLAAAPARVTASSSQGNVTVQLPRGSVSYRVHASTDQGVVSNTVAQNPASHRDVRATSDQGDVTVRYRGR